MAQTRTKLGPQNPLAVIASLIAVVEIAFAYPVTVLSDTNQTILVVFLVSFPVLLLLCFFLTVWFRPGHLYSPKDYSKDESFLEGIGRLPAGSPKRIGEQPTAQQAVPPITPPGSGLRQTNI